jgi:starch synthase
MRVAFVTSEVAPFSKTGGLGDVSGALPQALAAAGVDVTVYSPLYRSAAAVLRDIGLSTDDHAGPTLWIGNERHAIHWRTTVRDGVRIAFLADDIFFDRPTLYVGPDGADYPDNVGRFAFLCRAVLEHWLAEDAIPDVVHVNDWQTALLPVYLHTIYRRPAFERVRSVLTIHNLAFQGRFPAPQLYATGLDWSVFTVGGLEFFGDLNFLKGGLLFADALTTVSPSYAEEIQQPEYGNALDGVLRTQRHKLSGILNGVDTARWDPRTDSALPVRYDPKSVARGKAACKRALQHRMGVPARDDAFLLGAISRLDAQKGIPLIADALQIVSPLPMQLVLLGSGDAAIEQQVRELALACPEQVGVVIGFDEALAHLIEAGADAFLMPSRYEPCGLNQMYSQRYGTVPIVHATGGLKDTVIDYSPERLEAGTASGFVFAPFDARQLTHAILRAWHLFTSDPRAWRRLQTAIMQLDHSWAASAALYAALYRRLAGAA